MLMGGGGRFLAGGGGRCLFVVVGGEARLVSVGEKGKMRPSGLRVRMEDGGELDGRELLEIGVLVVCC
jgi:hypothetical protein